MKKWRQMETKVRIMHIIYQIYIFFYGLVLFVLSLLCYETVGDPSKNYDLILTNWAQNPITEIYSGSVCNQGDLVLTRYRWPGTEEGCECPKAQNGQSDIFKGRCSKKLRGSGCKGVGSVGNRNFQNFTDVQQTFTYTLCGILDKSFDFLNQAPLTYDCPSGTLKCGEEDKFICTNQTKCPIVEIGYYNDNNQSNEHLIITDAFKLWYNRFSPGLFPVAEFRISEGEGVCLENALAITPGRSDYQLMESFKVDCGKKDPRFKQLYTMNEELFYEINRSLDLPELLPDYIIDPMYQWGLYYRGYVPWKIECRGQIKKQFQSQQSILKEFHEIQYALYVSTLVYFLVIAVMTNFFSIIFDEWAIIFIIFNFMFQVSFAALTGMQFFQSQNQIQIFNEIYNLNCTDNETQWIIQDLSRNLKECTYPYNFGLFTISMVSFIFYIIPIIYYICQCFRQRLSSVIPIENNQQIEIQQLEIQQNVNNPDERNMESNPINYPNM